DCHSSALTVCISNPITAIIGTIIITSIGVTDSDVEDDIRNTIQFLPCPQRRIIDTFIFLKSLK
ncbi:MAG: hypothetical protein ACI8RD_012615, partial [Bacillariaceae sp.]